MAASTKLVGVDGRTAPLLRAVKREPSKLFVCAIRAGMWAIGGYVWVLVERCGCGCESWWPCGNPSDDLIRG
jgi:hypothetical protein